MAEVFDTKKTRRALAKQAKPAVRATADVIAARARGRLAMHRAEGDSRIDVEHGAIDSYVVLEDEASLSIEFGRGAYTRSDGREIGAMEGLHIVGGAI